MSVFGTMESEVRSYSRAWPTVFTTGHGALLRDESGRAYLGFFAGAGALNYGHNPPELKAALLEYLSGDGVTHGLDMNTTAKRAFLERFRDPVLVPRGLDYRVQFPGPGRAAPTRSRPRSSSPGRSPGGTPSPTSTAASTG
ncbi:hypothetical protein ACFVZC_35395 [Streptomyces marokkonensis]|uniref:Diaminobutyrate--2-oxoglutarate transaminase n=1 Tax=Streptomyces marokkonensis TaxID=324855 RepID=A0ABW6QHK6_9ACTN